MNSNDKDDFNELQGWLADQDGSGAELWNPAAGETLIGTFLRYETRYSPKLGGDTKVAIIEEAGSGDLYAVWLSRSVLASEYERQNPQEGDSIGHKYHGLKQPRGAGQAYHNYTVRVLRGPGGRPPAAPPVAPSPPSLQAAPPVAATPGARSDDDLPW